MFWAKRQLNVPWPLVKVDTPINLSHDPIQNLFLKFIEFVHNAPETQP